MKKLILASAAGLLLATANTPPTAAGAKPEGELTSVVAAEAPADARPAKPAKPGKPARIAAAPEAAAAAYPHCSATVRDRCVQGRSGHSTHARRIQLAMRAGERG